MKEFKLPTYEEAEKRDENGKATALDRFILNQEIAGEVENVNWRSELTSAINYLLSIQEKEAVPIGIIGNKFTPDGLSENAFKLKDKPNWKNEIFYQDNVIGANISGETWIDPTPIPIQTFYPIKKKK